MIYRIFMKKLIVFNIVFFTIHLYAGSGTIVVENKTNNNIIIKLETTTGEVYKKNLDPKTSFEKTLSRTIGTPDIKNMSIKFPDNEQVNTGDANINGYYLDYRLWTQNVNIKNDQTTNVKIFYNTKEDVFERSVLLGNKTQEKKGEYEGDSAESAMFFKNKTPYKLILHTMVAGSLEWATIELEPYGHYSIWPGISGLTTNDLGHMALEFKNENDVKKDGLKLEKRWWRNVIDNKRHQVTEIYIKYDKATKRFIRSAYRKNKHIESFGESIGIKFKGDYKLLPTRPNKRQVKIKTDILKLQSEISALEAQKEIQDKSRDAAKWTLEKTLRATLGLSQIAQEASEGLLSIYNIKNAVLSGSIQDIIHGKLPALEIDCEIIGNPQNFVLEFDFAHPENTFKNIGDKTGKSIKK